MLRFRKIGCFGLILLGVLAYFITKSTMSEPKTFQYQGKTVVAEPYGLFNQSKKLDYVQYDINGWDVAWSIIFFEVIFPPVFLAGYDMYQPVGIKPEYQTEKNVNLK